jgi:NDP-sugar pyrophosphorylase family protein
MIGVVLAAGRGKRMGVRTATTPKPLLPLRGEPILAHVLRGLASAEVREVVLVVGYLGEQIVRHFEKGERWGVRLDYVWQERAEGTAAALLLARERIGTRPFFLSWADVVVSRSNYAALRAAFERTPCAAWIGVNEVEDPCAGAAVYLGEHDRVLRIVEKPPPGTSSTRWNNSGLGIYSAVLCDYAATLAPSPRGERELPQAVQAMIADGHEVRALRLQGFWSDLGTPEALARAECEFDPDATTR